MKKFANKLINQAAKKNIDAVDIFINRGKELTVSVRDGSVEKIETALPVGIGVRVLKDNRQGFSYTTDINDLEVVARAARSLDFVQQDNCFGLAIDSAKQSQKDILKLYDPSIDKLAAEDALDLSLSLEKKVYSLDKRITKTESAGFFAVSNEEYLFNSNGVDLYQQGTYCGASAEVVAEEAGQLEAGSGYELYRSFAEFNQDSIAQKAADDAVTLLGAENAKSGKYLVFLEAKVVRQFLSLFAGAFKANNYQKGKSMFEGKLGEQILLPEISIIDSPNLVSGLGSFYFDGDGLSGEETKVVSQGKFSSLLYDVYTANKDGVASTGNAVRSYNSLPDVGVSNFYLKHSKAINDIFAGNDGLVITRVMGLHTANPITGEFSFGAGGYFLKKGKKGGGVRNMAIAGNLKDFFNSIVMAEEKIHFQGNLGAPSLAINEVTIAGE